MIYLIKLAMLCVAEDQQDDVVIPVLKIGYSNDDRKKPRFDDYTNNGHCIRVLKSIPGGSIDLEHRIQTVFKKYRVPGRSMEWFYTEKEIIDVFDSCNSEEDLYNYLQRVEPKKLTKSQDFLLNWEEKLPELELIYSAESLNRVRDELLAFYADLTTFPDKMKFLCGEVPDGDLELFRLFIPKKFFNYLDLLGAAKIKALAYRNDYIKEEYNREVSNQSIDIKTKILTTFSVGNRYPMSKIKEMLRDIYQEAGYDKTPKATDLLEYYKLKRCEIVRQDDKTKKDNGFLLVSLVES